MLEALPADKLGQEAAIPEKWSQRQGDSNCWDRMDHEAQTQKRNPGQPVAEYLVGKVSFVAYVLTECVSDPTLKLREVGEHFSDSSVDLVSTLAYGKLQLILSSPM